MPLTAVTSLLSPTTLYCPDFGALVPGVSFFVGFLVMDFTSLYLIFNIINSEDINNYPKTIKSKTENKIDFNGSDADGQVS